MNKALKLFLIGFGVFAAIITLGLSLNANATSVIVIGVLTAICFTALFNILCKKELEEDEDE